jgi:phospholipid transport system substrate-binding protein
MNTLLAAFFLLLAAPLALAEELGPDLLIRRISEEVLQSIREDAALRAGDPAKLAALVEAKVLPHFDFARATQTAMGQNWRHATPAQKEALTREFRALLVRTYSGALSAYRDQTITVTPLRARASETEVTVRSHIRRPGAETMTIEYDMEKSSGAWKAFDIRVGGISLVANYRTAFAEEIRNHGVEGLLRTLAEKNRGPQSAAARL